MQHGAYMPENLAGCKAVSARITSTPDARDSGILRGMSKKPPSELQQAVVARLRAVQAEMGKSDSAMGQLVGVSRSRWSNWVTGGNMPEEEAMIRLCAGAQITLDWLYRGSLKGVDPSLGIRLELRTAGLDPDRATPAERGATAEHVLASSG